MHDDEHFLGHCNLDKVYNLTTFLFQSSVINKWQKSANGIPGYVLDYSHSSHSLVAPSN